MRIVLIGYMASGKSAIGKHLSKLLKLDFFDLDEVIETFEKTTIANLFETKGEVYFRKKEIEVLHYLLQKDNLVLATGGGTPCYANNMGSINLNATHSFYLRLSLPTLVDRIKNEKAQRPMVKNIPDEELEEFIGKHLFERSFFYTQAKETIVCDYKDIDEIANEITTRLI